MSKILSRSLHKWLMTFLFGLCALSVFLWLSHAPLHKGAVIAALFLWTLLLTLLDGLWGWKGAVGLTALSVGAMLLAADKVQLVQYITALFTSPRPQVSVAGDLALLCALAVISLAALYVLEGFWSRAVFSTGWVIFWIIAAVAELSLPRMAAAAAVPILLFTLVQALQRAKEKGEGQNFAQLSSGLMVLFFAAFLLLMIMPAPKEPYDYPLLNAIWDKVEEVYKGIETKLFFRQEGSDQYSVSFWGYSGMGVTEDGEEEILQLRARYTTAGNLYLFGNSSNSFTGSGWYSTLDEDTAGDLLDWNYDTAERIYAMWRFEQQDGSLTAAQLMRENNIYVYYSQANTRTMFITDGMLQTAIEDKRYPWEGKPGRNTFDYLQRRETYYRVYFLEENPDYLSQLIQSAEGYSYDPNDTLPWNRMYMAYREDFVLDMALLQPIEPLLAQRNQLIRDNYLAVPDSVSPRVRELALEITEGCGSDYEKMLAISAYLQTNYAYTTNPKPIPEGAQLLDYMLFESREGYCTWYATAAAMMGRCAGVPTRFVQGYCVPLFANNNTIVRADRGHAWCEAYIQGYGWVTVEATPGYELGGTGWDKAEDTAGSGGDGAGATYAPDEEEEEFVPLPAQKDETEQEEVSAPSWLPQAVFIGLSVAAFTAFMLVMGKLEKQRREYERASFSQRTVIDLEKLLQLLARRGYKREPNESIRAYFGRLKWVLPFEPQELTRMAAVYESVIFGGREVTEEEWRQYNAFAADFKKLRRR